MGSNNFFSYIVYVDNPAGLEKCVESLLGSPDTLKMKTEVLILDPVCSPESMTEGMMLEKRYPSNVTYHFASEMSMAECYNFGLAHAGGMYVNFTKSGSFLDNATSEQVYQYITTHHYPMLTSISAWTINENEFFAQYRISPHLYDGWAGEIDLEVTPGRIHLCLHCYFIRRSMLLNRKETFWFRDLGEDTCQNYLLRLLGKTGRFDYISYGFYHYTSPMEDNTSAFLGQYDPAWYLETMKEHALSLLRPYEEQEEEIPEFLLKAVLWIVFTRFNCNYNDRNKGVLEEESLRSFYSGAGEVLSHLDDEVIWNRCPGQLFTIPRTLRVLLLTVRSYFFQENREVFLSRNSLWTYSMESGREAFVFDRSNPVPEMQSSLLQLSMVPKEQVIVDVLNFHDGVFSLDGRCSIGDFGLTDRLKIHARIGEREIPVSITEEYPLIRVFGQTYQKRMRFRVFFEEKDLQNGQGLSFFVELNHKKWKLRLLTGSVYAHASLTPMAYWKYGKKNSYLYIHNGSYFLENTSKTGIQAKESQFEESLALLAQNEKRAEAVQKALKFRQMYFRQKKAKKKPIWVSFDKLYKAGDNGEYIFHYIREHVPELDMYYLIKDDSPDYPRLMESDRDHILVWGRDETIVKMLLCDVILGTHANILSNAGIDKELVPYLSDLFDPFHVCIQHGLTVQNIAQFQNRLFDNTLLYLCASPNEVKNLLQPIYGYTEDMVKLTGVARYDGLKSNPKKQILITPTWRRNIANSNIAHFKKAHNEYFKSSTYFRLYNTLINDERLIRTAQETGYRIMYLIHPAVSSQIDDFDKNPFVDIVPAAGDMNYEKVLTESDLMVTDYSGVQFDFAYMRKPILYYHPKDLPPHYDESEAYVYERDAFGPLIAEHEQLVDELCAYMKSGCQMKEEYVERANRFFAFDDHNNCERIYNTIAACVRDRKKV